MRSKKDGIGILAKLEFIICFLSLTIFILITSPVKDDILLFLPTRSSPNQNHQNPAYYHNQQDAHPSALSLCLVHNPKIHQPLKHLTTIHSILFLLLDNRFQAKVISDEPPMTYHTQIKQCQWFLFLHNDMNP